MVGRVAGGGAAGAPLKPMAVGAGLDQNDHDDETFRSQERFPLNEARALAVDRKQTRNSSLTRARGQARRLFRRRLARRVSTSTGVAI